MPSMFPSKVEAFTTLGEELVYAFFQKALPAEYKVWYSPTVHNNQFDFLVYSPKLGIVVFEVKDWVLAQILKINPQEITLLINNKEEIRKNPKAQARNYLDILKNVLMKHEAMRSYVRAGNPCLPLSIGLIFPNITKKEYQKAKLESVFEISLVLLSDDIQLVNPQNDIDTFLKENRQFIFDFNLDTRQEQILKSLLFPELVIQTPRKVIQKNEFSHNLALLDEKQEEIARDFTAKKLCIHGASGSGKTLLLIHKLILLLQSQPQTKKVLMLCYNLSLVHYLRRVLAKKHGPLGENGVEVMAIYDLCEDILKEQITHQKEAKEYYETVVELALAECRAASPYKNSYDAIFIDEGQDFTPVMLELVQMLLKSSANVFCIALDEAQDVYSTQTTWENYTNFVHFHLEYQYRNTPQILDFISTQLNLPKSKHFAGYALRGDKPTVRNYANFDTLLAELSQKVFSLVEEGCAMNEIAVLFPTYKMEDKNIACEIVESFLEKGILSMYVSESEQSKRQYDITTENVTVSTIHSVKGMDYEYVFLICPDELSGFLKNGFYRKLFYVGMTRARFSLELLCLVKD